MHWYVYIPIYLHTYYPNRILHIPNIQLDTHVPVYSYIYIPIYSHTHVPTYTYYPNWYTYYPNYPNLFISAYQSIRYNIAYVPTYPCAGCNVKELVTSGISNKCTHIPIIPTGCNGA